MDTKPGQLDCPQGIALDRAGNIYLADTYNNRIQKFTPRRELLSPLGTTGNANPAELWLPCAIAVDDGGMVYVADTMNNRVQIFQPRWGKGRSSWQLARLRPSGKICGNWPTAMGATLFGVADVSRAFAVWPDSFQECGKLLTGISIGVAEDDNQLAGLPQTDDKYRTSHYNVNMALALRIGRYDCQAIAWSMGTRRIGCRTRRSIKRDRFVQAGGAVFGLGLDRKKPPADHAGKGAAGRPGGSLDRCSLPPTADKPLESQCGDCTRCIDVCPVKAFSTDPFGETDSLKGFATGTCAINRGTINPTGWGGCGLCMKVCPFGQRKANLLEETVKRAVTRGDLP